MRKITILFVLILLPLWAISYVIAEKSEVDLDPDLKGILEEELKTKNFSKKAILSVEQLDLSNYNLTSVKGIEEFTNLRELNLSNNLLTDSSFLNNLPHLEKIDLSFNHVDEIKSISENVVELNLRENLIRSIDFVENLPNLTYLNMRDNNIDELSSFAASDSLTYLNIRGNKIKTLEPLASLKNLDNLNIRDNQIQSIKPLTLLPLKKRLSLAGNDINDLHLLEDKLQMINDVDFEISLTKPKLSKVSGFYDEPFTIEIEAGEGTEIYYTLDGSMPNTRGKKYNGPIEISKDLMYESDIIANNKTSPEHDPFSFEAEDVKQAITIRAVATLKKTLSDGREFSEPVTATYILDDHLYESHLPIVSLTVDPVDLFDHYHGIYVPGVWYEDDSLWSGNYAKRGRDFERQATFELFDKNKQLDVHQEVGIRINGRATRRFPQKSLRIYARDDYGQTSIYTDVFESLDYNKFDLLLLRNSGQDYNSTLLRDGLMHELVKDLDVDLQAYQPAVVLINGEYWGVQNIRERLNEDYIVNKYNIDKNELILMKVFSEDDDIDFEIKSGSQQAKTSYFNLLDYVTENDMTIDKHFNHVAEQIDIDNYLHYVAYQIYYANTDSFSNNMRIWKKDTPYIEDVPKGHDGRWRWMFFDLDWGMGFWVHNSLKYEGDPVDFNMIEHVLKDERRMSLFRNLMENEYAREKFIYIMTSLLDNHFAVDKVKAKIDELVANIESEIPHTIKRWNNIESIEKWEENIQVLHDFAEQRPKVIKTHLMKKFNLTEADIEQIKEKMSE